MASAVTRELFRYPGVQIIPMDDAPVVSVCFLSTEVQSGIDLRDRTMSIAKDRCKFVDSQLNELNCEGDVVLEKCSAQKVTAKGNIYLSHCRFLQEVVTEGDILIEGELPLSVKASKVFTTTSSVCNISAKVLCFYHDEEPVADFVVKNSRLEGAICLPPTATPTLTLDHTTTKEVHFGACFHAHHPRSPIESRKIILTGGSHVGKVLGGKIIINQNDPA